MSVFICTDSCTYGNPPRFYSPGDKLILEGKCPRHFVPAAEAKAHGVEPVKDPEEQPETLSKAGTDAAGTLAADIQAKTADEPCTVEQLAEKLGIDVVLVKEASGRSRKDQMLTAEEISGVRSAIKKAQPET